MQLTKLVIGLSLALGFVATAAAQTTMRISISTAQNSHQGVAIDTFAKEVEKRTGGRYKVQNFYNGALGGERESIEAVQLGTQELAFSSTGPIPNFVPETKILDVPFLFRDKGHARAVLDGPIGQDMLAKFDDVGLHALGWGEQGFRHITNSRGPIAKPADLDGLKIRTMENPVHLEAFTALGAAPTPMAWPEVIPALEQGAIDGQENPLSVIVSAKLGEVQKYLSLDGHVYSPAIVMVSQKLWDSLDDTQKAAFEKAGDAAVVAMRGYVDNVEAQGVETLKAQGMQVNTLTPEDKQAFQDKLADVYVDYEKQFGKELMDSIIASK